MANGIVLFESADQELGDATTCVLGCDGCRKVIDRMRFGNECDLIGVESDLIGNECDLFGVEKHESFKAIKGSIGGI